MLKLKKISLRGGAYILFLLITGLLNASSVSPDVMEEVAGTQLSLEMDNESITTRDTRASSPLKATTSNLQRPGALPPNASLALSQKSVAPKEKEEESDDEIDLEDVALYGGIAAGAVVGTAAVGSVAGSAVTTYLARSREKEEKPLPAVRGTQELIEDMKAGRVGPDEISRRVDEAARVDRLTLQDVYKQLDAEHARLAFSRAQLSQKEIQRNDLFQAALIGDANNRRALTNSQKDALNPLISGALKLETQENIKNGLEEVVIRSNLPLYQAYEELATKLSQKLPDIEKQLATNEITEKNIRIQYEAANKRLEEAKTPQEEQAALNSIDEAKKGLDKLANEGEDLKRNHQLIRTFIGDFDTRSFSIENKQKELSERVLRLREFEEVVRSEILKMQKSKDFNMSEFKEVIGVIKDRITAGQLKKIFEDEQAKAADRQKELEVVVEKRKKDIKEQEEALEKLKQSVQEPKISLTRKNDKIEVSVSYFDFQTEKEGKLTRTSPIGPNDNQEEIANELKEEIKKDLNVQIENLKKSLKKTKNIFKIRKMNLKK